MQKQETGRRIFYGCKAVNGLRGGRKRAPKDTSEVFEFSYVMSIQTHFDVG